MWSCQSLIVSCRMVTVITGKYLFDIRMNVQWMESGRRGEFVDVVMCLIFFLTDMLVVHSECCVWTCRLTSIQCNWSLSHALKVVSRLCLCVLMWVHLCMLECECMLCVCYFVYVCWFTHSLPIDTWCTHTYLLENNATINFYDTLFWHIPYSLLLYHSDTSVAERQVLSLQDSQCVAGMGRKHISIQIEWCVCRCQSLHGYVIFVTDICCTWYLSQQDTAVHILCSSNGPITL